MRDTAAPGRRPAARPTTDGPATSPALTRDWTASQPPARSATSSPRGPARPRRCARSPLLARPRSVRRTRTKAERSRAIHPSDPAPRRAAPWPTAERGSAVRRSPARPASGPRRGCRRVPWRRPGPRQHHKTGNQHIGRLLRRTSGATTGVPCVVFGGERDQRSHGTPVRPPIARDPETPIHWEKTGTAEVSRPGLQPQVSN